ncbi:MAG: hypothetical protein KJ578_07380 [Bacteroidetes bacterium]|nr:hypothetical protein [Bacteroidota bacterium]MBU1580974.1 hypothetical protein [Bacteroidota bacterium]MBU2557584.1 hypothetical protein [Bacteroidota bacterium]
MSRVIKNKIDDALFNFYLEADKDIIKDSLQENIQNLVEYEQKKKKLLFLAKATAKKRHNDSLMELANKFQEALLLNIEKPIAILKQLVQGNPSFALYRNLDKISKEDIIEIIKDKNLIQLFEQLEENDKSH